MQEEKEDITKLQRYQKLEPHNLYRDDIPILVKMGKLYYSKNDYAPAIMYAQRILELKPANIDALNLLSYSYYYQNDEEKATEYCTKWIAADIQNPSIPLALLNRIYERKAQRHQEEIIRIEKENARLEEAEKFRQKLEQMIQQYTHTLSNTLLPYTIYQAANALKNHREFQKIALLLFRAYQAELFIYKQGELLEIKHTGDTEKFRSYIRRSCLDSKIEKDFTTIEKILDAVTSRVLTRFLTQGKLDHIRQILSTIQGESGETWQVSFDNDVFVTAQKTAVQWANEHIARIDVVLSETWKNLKFKTGEESYAEALIWGHFGELLFNALKYTDHRQKKWVTIIFDEEERYLTALWENPCLPGVKSSDWRSKGLESIRNDLEMLNQAENTPKSLEMNRTESSFRVKLYLAKNVFVYQSKIQRNRKLRGGEYEYSMD